MDYKVGDRVAKDWRDRGETHTAFGTVAYVKPDRIGVKWDVRDGFTFPAKRNEVRKVSPSDVAKYEGDVFAALDRGEDIEDRPFEPFNYGESR